MDVKFKNGLCNCAPSKLEGHGTYAWIKGASERLKNISKLPRRALRDDQGCPATDAHRHRHDESPKDHSGNNNNEDRHRHG
ncbi:MAG: hypothetical protein ACKPKO_19050, partial [Candidatus Fonsibacter sp.]